MGYDFGQPGSSLALLQIGRHSVIARVEVHHAGVNYSGVKLRHEWKLFEEQKVNPRSILTHYNEDWLLIEKTAWWPHMLMLKKPLPEVGPQVIGGRERSIIFIHSIYPLDFLKFKYLLEDMSIHGQSVRLSTIVILPNIPMESRELVSWEWVLRVLKKRAPTSITSHFSGFKPVVLYPVRDKSY